MSIMMANHDSPRPRILIARPGAREQALRETLEHYGLAVANLNIMRLEAQAPEQEMLRWLYKGSVDTLLCVSPFAVECLVQWLNPVPEWVARAEMIATGKSTGEAMAAAFGRGLDDIRLPMPGYRAASEAVLALPSLQAIRGRQVLMACGEQGRPLLRQQLVERGARVDELRLYRRHLLPPSASLARVLAEGDYAALIVTSAEQLSHIAKWCNDVSLANPLVVSSQRLAEKAKAKGFERVLRAQDATPQALAECCARLVLDK